MLAPRRRAILGAGCLWLCVASGARAARAQSGGDASDELAGARATFAEALRDEEAKRFAAALEKFRRVRTVRDTAAVEYRIGTCYEGLGLGVDAYTAYREATKLGQDDPRSAEVVAASADRLHALDKHLASLTLSLPSEAPSATEVRVDDRALPVASLQEPVVLEPGTHVVTAVAPGMTPSRSEIVLPEGAHVSLTIPMGPPAPPPPPPPVAPASTNPMPEGDAPAHEADSLPGSASPSGTLRSAGWVAAVGGGALLVGGGVVWALRESDIGKLHEACPNGMCRAGSDESDLTATRNRALTEGPVAIALGAVGALALVSGAYLLWETRKDDRANTRGARKALVVPVLAQRGGGAAVVGEF
jgi:hypothetical protein